MTATLTVIRSRNEVAMEINYNPRALIEAIRIRPGCWNTSHSDYKDKQTRATMWAEVAKAMCSDPSLLSKSALNQIIVQVQKRWKHMRDYFLAIIVSRKKTQRQRPYIYYEKLKFLLKGKEPTELLETYKKRVTLDGGETEAECEDEQNQNYLNKKAITTNSILPGGDGDLDEVYQDMEDDSETLVGDPEVKIKQEYAEESDPFPEVQDYGQRFANDDSDRLFLVSLLPHLKSIPEAHRLTVKVEVMQLLDKANKKYC